MPGPVVVVEHDPGWPLRYDAIRRVIVQALGPAAAAIEHVGSTAVPGLAAKPIIDVDVAVADYSSAHELRPALEAAGFRRVPAGDFLDRQWYVLDKAGSRVCHLSLTFLDSDTWRAHLALRDRLLNDPQARSEYGRLKLRMVAEALDPGVYTEAKTDFIRGLIGEGWRKPPERRLPVSRRVLLIVGLALLLLMAGTAGIAHYAETSRGADGLPDHRSIRAADLAGRPEAKLFYPGSTAVKSSSVDQGSDPNNPSSGAAKIDNLLAVPATPDPVETWYRQALAARGWSVAPPALSAGTPAGEVDVEWRRGPREFFELTLYVDRAALGDLNYAVPGLLYRVLYLVGTGR